MHADRPNSLWNLFAASPDLEKPSAETPPKPRTQPRVNVPRGAVPPVLAQTSKPRAESIEPKPKDRAQRQLDFGSDITDPSRAKIIESTVEEQTNAVLNRISSKLDGILKRNQYLERNGQFAAANPGASNEPESPPTRPPLPPGLARPAWVSFGSRSRSRASNNSGESKDEGGNHNDSSLSLSKKSDYRIRPRQISKQRPSQPTLLNISSGSRHQLRAPLTRHINPSQSHIPRDTLLLDRSVLSALNASADKNMVSDTHKHLHTTTSSMKQSAYSLLHLLNSKSGERDGENDEQLPGHSRWEQYHLHHHAGGKENHPPHKNQEEIHIVKKDACSQQNMPNSHKTKKQPRTQIVEMEVETDKKQERALRQGGDVSPSDGSTLKKDLLVLGSGVQVSNFHLNEDDLPSPVFYKSTNLCRCDDFTSRLKTIIRGAERKVEERSKSPSNCTLPGFDSELTYKEKWVKSVKRVKLSSVKIITMILERRVKDRKKQGMRRMYERAITKRR